MTLQTLDCSTFRKETFIILYMVNDDVLLYVYLSLNHAIILNPLRRMIFVSIYVFFPKERFKKCF